MILRCRLVWVILCVALLSGCSVFRLGMRRDASDTFSTRADGRTGAASGLDRMEADLHFLDAFSEEMSSVLLESSVLATRFAGRDGYTQEDMDRFAYLLFRFQLCRAGLWEIADFYNNSVFLFGRGNSRLKAQLIGFRTAMQLAYYDSQFLLTYYDDDAERAALNRAYPFCQIEAGTYNAVLETALDPHNLDARDAAWHFFIAEREPSGKIGKAAADDPSINTLVQSIELFHMFGDASLARLLDKRGVVFPVFENRIRKSMAAGALKAVGEAGLSGLGAMCHLSLKLLKPLTRSPFSVSTIFSSEQVSLMKTLIQPGDILLVYTSGYLSSIFFPGVFKHGIVYVGSDIQRKTLKMEQRWHPSRRNDLIEAVAKGVVWNDLSYITGEHVTQFVVLRPILSMDDRRAYLQKVYDYLGRSYDLRFDFMDASRLCCTELIYHTLNGRGHVNFPMVQRFGMPTLSADDILKYFLQKPGDAFEMVFLGAPDPASANHEGVVLVGAEAVNRLRELLGCE